MNLSVRIRIFSSFDPQGRDPLASFHIIMDTCYTVTQLNATCYCVHVLRAPIVHSSKGTGDASSSAADMFLFYLSMFGRDSTVGRISDSQSATVMTIVYLVVVGLVRLSL